jgi:hypothetical protein
MAVAGTAIDVALWVVAGVVVLGGLLLALVAVVKAIGARRGGRPIE